MNEMSIGIYVDNLKLFLEYEDLVYYLGFCGIFKGEDICIWDYFRVIIFDSFFDIVNLFFVLYFDLWVWFFFSGYIFVRFE